MVVFERVKLIKAMEYIARHVNDEELLEYWLSLGVADSDIKYGDLSEFDESGDLDTYLEDDNFSEMMRVFLVLMASAKKSGGLFCDKVVSK